MSHIPFGVLYFISDILFVPIYYIVRYRRKIVRKNLTESFPNKNLAEIKDIEKKFYHFLIDVAFESCKLYSISSAEIQQRAQFTNIDLINSMTERGKSVSVFIGHYCNWEWITSLGLWFDKKVIPVQIFHKLRNKKINALMLRLRERFGHKSVEMYSTVRFITQEINLGNQMVIGFIADQSPKKREVRHFLPFLNHQVPVLTGIEKLTKHFGFDSVFLKVKRVKRGFYEFEFVPLCKDSASLPDFELTHRYYKLLEQEIEQCPEYYLWTHDRFKHATELIEDIQKT